MSMPGEQTPSYPYSPPGRSQQQHHQQQHHHSKPPTPSPLPLQPSFNSRNLPASPQNTNLPPIAAAIYSRDPPVTTSNYYDPTQDAGDRTVDRGGGGGGGGGVRFDGYSSERRVSYSYGDTRSSNLPSYDKPYHSSVGSTFPQHSPVSAHPPPPLQAYNPRPDASSQSPASPRVYQTFERSFPQPSFHSHERKPSREVPARTADPMSLSSIMSGTDDEPAMKLSQKAPQESRRSPQASGVHVPPKQERPLSPLPAAVHINAMNGANHQEQARINGATELNHFPQSNGQRTPTKVDEKDAETDVAGVDAMDISYPESPGFEEWREEYSQRGLKRRHVVEASEAGRRKRRRLLHMKRVIDALEASVARAKQEYFAANEKNAWSEVQAREIAEEKERKKEMQRDRRRQKTMAAETQKAKEAFERAQLAVDDNEKEHWNREAQKHERKYKTAEALLHGVTPSKANRDSTPHAVNMEGGVMGTLQVSEDAPKTSKRGGRGGRFSTRPRKSKEQKQMEKDQAAAAQAALERGEELPPIAPKEALRLEALANRGDSAHVEEPTHPPDFVPYTSKAYNQIYESIWKDISRKDIPRVFRIKNDSLQTKQSNLRKTAQLAAKEARRWQLRTNKSTKDVQARAKRSMREMLGFWKRNERDERDQRKMAERLELENAKKAEADREAARQRRKLNFLISQTELYSHFIGKKVKTAEMERSTDDVTVSDQTLDRGEPEAHTIDLPDSVAKVGTKVTNFEDLDFDGDEGALQEAAMANAQHAVLEAQKRAQAFNADENQLQDQLDEGEMNFQNPTSLQSIDIPQPKMLTCQLKEYQLKGLNWLVNLYEQGINGILADEMGLGKTVQSISVMAYLAETHNIWGPFLVVAPASTLHNWQQEITRFVPDLKVVPYWGTAKDRKVLRKFWDRKHITYRKDSQFHVLVTSYQLVVADTQYFQKMKWQYMILDEAQAIKSSQSSRWKTLLGFHCRNRLLLTGTPIQNNMQELWALLHFIMPSLFDSHDEFSDWFSKDIESHAQSNTKLNEDQLKRLHMILKPFMLRRIKKHVQKELGDKVELDVFCDLTYRQRAYYTNLRNKISIMDLIEKAAIGDDQDTATLMNLVMQFRKVCNHPDLFERADTTSPLAFSYFAETASFVREGNNVNVAYSVRNQIEYKLPRLVYHAGRLDLPGPQNWRAGWRNKYLQHVFNIWSPTNTLDSCRKDGTFSWLRFVDTSPNEAYTIQHQDIYERAIDLKRKQRDLSSFNMLYDGSDDEKYIPRQALLNIMPYSSRQPLADITTEGHLHNLFNISRTVFEDRGLDALEACARPGASAPPIELFCSSQTSNFEKQKVFFNVPMRSVLYPMSTKTEEALLEAKVDPSKYPVHSMLPAPEKLKPRFTHIQVPSMRRFVSDCGKLARLDQLLRELKEGGHRVLLYFQMTRMIDLMEEYLTYRNYKYCRLDGSTKLEDRRDTVADFQTRPEIFVFLLSTRAGGLGINLTSADTVIFYDSDWNPTIDSQAMDRAHRLGQTKQVTVYRLITRGTIEERIRKRALQKEEVQRVVISGQAAGGQVDFNARSRENRTKDIALWLADDEQAAEIEKKEREMEELEKLNPGATTKRKGRGGRKGKEVSMDDMYHEGEGHFEDAHSAKPSGAATPISEPMPTGKRKRGGISKKAKTMKQRLAIADGEADPSTFQ